MSIRKSNFNCSDFKIIRVSLGIGMRVSLGMGVSIRV